ncbi:hypothetical protein HG537_0H01880 [Torulaspora globosa]|uniref:Large ribosomal subunit protein bL34m n=1 Tax=Torulaspora globosa TaxID=48254 RepID=A0A7H9I0S0_9SACH|nr:hypothetical protein HG537_0H01880 [Torulaspora sp. CBS 2947]
MSFFVRSICQLNGRRTLTSLSSFSPLKSIGLNTNTSILGVPQLQIASLLLPFGQTLQRRWKSRGNTFQPSTLKRKRRIGFLARARSKSGSKILQRRKAKGRWFLTH